MAKITITETKTWCLDDVRSLCIERDYYTRGTCKDYDKMLHFVATHEPTKMNIYKVAKDIVEHSNLDRYSEEREELIAGVMYDITDYAVNTHYTITR